MKIGIALGSGGARGLAHIGVLEELAAMGLEPDLVAGTSMGSLIGAGYCTGRLGEIKELALGMDVMGFLFRFMEFGMPRSGLIEGRRVNELLDKLMPEATFENLRKPLRCVATDLRTGDPYVFSEGRLQPAIRASISVPGVFSPAKHEGKLLIDGGLVNPIPVDQLREMGADKIIAVDVNHGCLQRQVGTGASGKSRKPKGMVGDWLRKAEEILEERDPKHLERIKEWFAPDPMPNLIDVIGGMIHIVETQVGKMRMEIDPPDVLLAPEVGDMEMFDFHHAEEIIEAGRASVRAASPHLRFRN